MAKQVNEQNGAQLGYETRVYNLNRHHNASEYYTAIWTIGEDGEPKCRLFTKAMLNDAEKRAATNPEDLPVYRRGFLKRLFGIK
jgi:hypothetical protein